MLFNIAQYLLELADFLEIACGKLAVCEKIIVSDDAAEQT